MENVTGLKYITEDMDVTYIYYMHVVEERSSLQWSRSVNFGGALGSENAGMSNHKTGENPVGRKSKVSWAMVIISGLVGPKPRRIA